VGELDKTSILFQMDHGVEGKGSLFETGARIAQFIHYPVAINKVGHAL
jgi:arylsulfatase A-like enzyme